jgi:hypothetical protein
MASCYVSIVLLFLGEVFGSGLKNVADSHVGMDEDHSGKQASKKYVRRSAAESNRTQNLSNVTGAVQLKLERTESSDGHSGGVDAMDGKKRVQNSMSAPQTSLSSLEDLSHGQIHSRGDCTDEEAFKFIDNDDNKIISKAEWSDFFKGVFKKVDKDDNKIISKAELGDDALFEIMDTDKSGGISEDEWQKYFDDAFEGLDTDKSGDIILDELKLITGDNVQLKNIVEKYVCNNVEAPQGKGGAKAATVTQMLIALALLLS